MLTAKNRRHAGACTTGFARGLARGLVLGLQVHAPRARGAPRGRAGSLRPVHRQPELLRPLQLRKLGRVCLCGWGLGRKRRGQDCHAYD